MKNDARQSQVSASKYILTTPFSIISPLVKQCLHFFYNLIVIDNVFFFVFRVSLLFFGGKKKQ